MSKFFLDTEFIDNGITIDLISIALVHQNNSSYYAVCSEYDPKQACFWVRDNVFPNLGSSEPKKASRIREEIVSFIELNTGSDKIEIYGYYSAYDWVAFCQLFGTMMDLPKGFPQYCRDLKQMLDDLGNPKLPVNKNDFGIPHNALCDAFWHKNVYQFLKEQHV